MSAGSAQEQIPTRTRSVGLEDLFVDAGWDDAVDVDRLRDVLEGLLPDALEDEVMTDALGRRRGERPREERPAHRRTRRSVHLRDVREDLGAEAGPPCDLPRGGEVGERLDAVATVDGEPFDERRGLELLDHRARAVRTLLEHGALDGRDHGRREPAGRPFVLACSRIRLESDSY